MAESVGTIYYTVESDTSRLVNSSESVDASLDRMNRQFARTDKAARKTSFQMTKTAEAVKGLGSHVGDASNMFGGLTKVLGGLLTLRAGQGLLSMVEGYTEMADRVQIATSSVAEYELVQSRLLTTSNATERALSEAQELYLQSSISIKNLGYSTEQTLDITDSLSHAFAANAASAQSASTAITAFSKATVRGKVDSMGWVSILNAAPTLVEDIAQAAGKTTAEINKLGVEGRVTAEMLTEGLRQSLESNRRLDESMHKTVAGSLQKLRNNIAALAGEANRSTGATQVMADAVGFLADNVETLAAGFVAIGAGALAKYITQLTLSVAAQGKAIIAAKQHAAEQLNLARAHMAETQVALQAVRANTGLTASHGQAAAAARAHAAATEQMRIAQAAAATGGVRLLGLLGGPAGVVALFVSAAAAITTFGSAARAEKVSVDNLSDSVKELGDRTLELHRIQLKDKISELESLGSAAAKSGAQAEYLKKQMEEFPNSPEYGNWSRELAAARAEEEQSNAELNEKRQRLKEVNEELEKRSGATRRSSKAVSEETEEGQKYVKNLEQQNELLKVQGEERVRLKVRQDLQGKATEKEIAQAEELAVKQHRLEKAQSARTVVTKASAKVESENARVIARLNEELFQATLSGEELAKAKAIAQLNKFATPEEVEEVKQLAAALHEITEENRRREKFGSGHAADQYIMGNVDPLSGGVFDDQIARYEAEAEVERERYAEQLERLKEARALQIETSRSYDELEAQAAQQHADRMAQIEQAKMSVLLTSASDGFGAIADVLKHSHGEQSGIYKAMFAASKAFAVASATINAYDAISKAWASAPFPANLGAVAATTPKVMAVVSAISGASYGGGRQYGGPVSPNKMYRINESGDPEIFNAAGGKQYFLPNRRGDVVPFQSVASGSTQQATGSSSRNIKLQFEINNNITVTRMEDDTTEEKLVEVMDQISKKTQMDIAESVRTNGVWSRIIGG